MGLSVLAHVDTPSPTDPWAFNAHPDVWALVLGLLAAYLLAARRVGPSRVVPGEEVLPRRKLVLFSLGLLALWVHADWPIHDISENHLLSVHMFQHTGFMLIAAPLLLLGLPTWMARWLFVERVAVRQVLRRLTHPLVAGVLFNVVNVLAHWPVLVNLSLEQHPVHAVVHVVLVGSALLMWMPVVNRLPELPAMSYPVRMLYLFLQSVLPTIPASFLTFGESPLFHFYAHAPRAFDLSVIDDQQLAGALMKVYAGLLLWGVIIGMFFRWYASEQQPQRGPDKVLTWADVERELERTRPVR